MTDFNEAALEVFGPKAWQLRLDPYLVWATLTGFRDYLAPDEPKFVNVAIECLKDVKALEHAIKVGGLNVMLSPLYTGSTPELPPTTDANVLVIDPSVSSFCTARVAASDLVPLLALVKRLEMGTAVQESPPILPYMRPAKPSLKVVVGIIDDFVAFAHPCFATATQSRVRYVWSQERAFPRTMDPSQWYAPKDLGYGYELNTLPSASGKPAPTLAMLQRAYPTVLSRQSHGTAVAGLAAGNRRADPAPSTADIIAVHLPRRMVSDTSGGALTVQALDGIKYIVERAGATARVVVNVSYGTMAGPHDGSSILEQAIDELVAKRDGQLAVVVPAGNSYEARTHARFVLMHSRPRRDLTWIVPPDCRTPSFLEVWLLPDDAHADVQIKVTDPAGRVVCAPKAPYIASNSAHVDEAVCGIVYLPQVANGMNGTMILIVLAPTGALRPGRALAKHGRWTVELTSSSIRAVAVDAWIERDDSLRGYPSGGRQSYFADATYELPGKSGKESIDNDESPIKRKGSFNSIATGDQTISVGGYVGPVENRRLARESGSGPMRGGTRRGPDITACSEESATLHGVLTPGNGAGDTVRMNGTSVAAPQVTRVIAELLVSGPQDAEAIRAALARRTCRKGVQLADPDREGRGRMC